MLHSFLFAPFAAPSHQEQFDAVRAALETEATPGITLLLGNFSVADEAFDAVILRPHSITTLLFVAGQGQLTIPALEQGDWQLGEAPIANAFAAFQRKQPVLAAWLGADLSASALQPQDITGVVLLAEASTFGPTVEPQLRRQPEADSFHLLRQVAHLPRRLWPLVRPGIQLTEAALQSWAQELAPEAAETADDLAEEVAELVAPMGFWEDKAQQLWRWLGAEDIPEDRPYGYQPPDAATTRHDEKQRLEQIRQQVRAELQVQNQAAAAREAQREQLIHHLQDQLRESSALAPETQALQARLAAEMREKAALQEAVRVSQAESAARHQQLDARIEQLGHLMQQLQARPGPAGPAAPAPALAAPAGSSAARVARRPQAWPPPSASWQLQWHRVAVVAAVAGGLGWGVWGVVQLTSQLTATVPTPTHTSKPRRSNSAQPADEEPEADLAQLRVDSLEEAGAAQQRAEAARDSIAAPVVPAEPADSSEVLQPTTEPELDDTSGGQ